MNYREARKMANELDDKVEKARNEAHYAVRRLETDLAYSGEENRGSEEELYKSMLEAREAMYKYFDVLEEYEKLMTAEIVIEDNRVA
jgi:hypothetical protein